MCHRLMGRPQATRPQEARACGKGSESSAGFGMPSVQCHSRLALRPRRWPSDRRTWVLWFSIANG